MSNADPDGTSSTGDTTFNQQEINIDSILIRPCVLTGHILSDCNVLFKCMYLINYANFL